MSALGRAGARVPAPIVACDDDDLTGAPLHVMERLDGVVIRNAVPRALDEPTQRARVAKELVAGMVEVHQVDVVAVGLDTLSRPGGYLERQLERWSEQLRLTRECTRALPGIDAITPRPHANVPADSARTLVHGDFKLDNLVYPANAPVRLLAILDWELCALGDPLADLGYCLSY